MIAKRDQGKLVVVKRDQGKLVAVEVKRYQSKLLVAGAERSVEVSNGQERS